MSTQVQLRDKIQRLRQSFERIEQRVSLGEQEALVQFFVRVLPRLYGAQRCGIFLIAPESGLLQSRYGTDLAPGKLEVPAKKSIAGMVFQSGNAFLDNFVDAETGSVGVAEEETGFRTQQIICVPIVKVNEAERIGVIQILNKEGGFSTQDVELLEEVSRHLARNLESVWLNESLASLSHKITRDFEQVDSMISDSHPFIASDSSMQDVVSKIHAVSRTPVNIMLRGENGTGKEVVARMIYETSMPKAAPFVPVNCAAIPENLLESEFFGYEKGAFTGAASSRGGFLEEATGGILFLDEIGELPLSMQAKLLRVLQEKEGRRVGGKDMVAYDFRLLSATNRDLEEMVQQATFREDLYYRLFSLCIELPPLRERKRDIGLMAVRFLGEISESWSKVFSGFSAEAVELLTQYSWPGNVRQLRREVERLVTLLPEDSRILPEHLSEGILSEVGSGNGFESVQDSESGLSVPIGSGTLKERTQAVEKEIIRIALRDNNNNRSDTATELGITRQSLYLKMKKMGLLAQDG